MSFQDYETEGRRLGILRILARRNQFTTNEYSLNDELTGAYAHHVSRDRLHSDLAWLDEQGLVITQQPRAGWVITLTSRGDDVAAGLAQVPGVARPRPGA
ncbi:ArsR family transcriptional regulator [Halomonas sp. PAMB 3232]|uniref:VpaChn25_0724 family phage protein n=1 Tax=Halomonas sp. PAMB 3232 TaxID=3075221 RepID=UPI00289DEF28|nr:ArsR family transcriptional regulator [Halomonas sp. PAMB 3232]WNL39837.1 ArsR family transcriptional regulator [Halomonas sp. PAMB 3232]